MSQHMKVTTENGYEYIVPINSVGISQTGDGKYEFGNVFVKDVWEWITRKEYARIKKILTGEDMAPEVKVTQPIKDSSDQL